MPAAIERVPYRRARSCFASLRFVTTYDRRVAANRFASSLTIVTSIRFLFAWAVNWTIEITVENRSHVDRRELIDRERQRFNVVPFYDEVVRSSSLFASGKILHLDFVSRFTHLSIFIEIISPPSSQFS